MFENTYICNLPALCKRFNVAEIILSLGKYSEGGLAVTMQCIDDAGFQGPFCKLSVWFPDSVELDYPCFYLKAWSENTLIADALHIAGLIKVSKKYANKFQVLPYGSSSIYELNAQHNEVYAAWIEACRAEYHGF